MNNFIAKIDDYLNAILVKDLRQIVRGKFIWAVLLLFLGIVSLILCLSLLDSGDRGEIDGEFIPVSMLGLLFFASALLIPIQIGKKTSEEIYDATHELIFTTTMDPSSIVKGKFLSGSVTIIMMYATLAPFLALTLYMGGVDIKNLILVIIYSFIMSHVAVLFQVHLGLSYKTDIIIAGIGHKIGIIIVHIIAWIWASTFGGALLNGEYSRYTGTENFWVNVIIFLLMVSFVSIILYCLTVSRLQAEVSNRSYLFKSVTTAIWIIGTLVFSFNKDHAQFWCVIVFIVIAVLSLALLLDPETYSERVLLEIPTNPVARLIKFPLFTGMVNSLAWILIIAAFNYIYGLTVVAAISPSYSGYFEFLSAVAIVFIYGLAYFLIANFIKNMFFKDKPRSTITGILVSILLIFTFGPLIAEAFMPYGTRGLISIISPFGVFYDGLRNVLPYLIFGVIALIAAIFLNISKLITQINDYFNTSERLKEYNKMNNEKFKYFKDYDWN